MNRKALILFLTVLAVAGFVMSSVNAQAPSTMTYQGKLTLTDGTVVVGAKQIIFSIYTVATGGSAVWTETINVQANDNGVFTAVLGQTTPLGVAVFDGDPVYLGLRVSDEANEMSPRQLLTSTAYAISAAYTENIPDNSVTSAKIVNGAVVSTKIASGAVTNSQLATNAVTGVKILDGTITADDIGTGAVANAEIATGAVSSSKLGTGAVTSAAIANSAVTSAAIATDAVSKVKLASDVDQLLPIAFAWISSGGTKVSGTANVSSTWNSTDKQYEITISGENYYYTDYVTVVSAGGGAYIPRVTSVGGKLVVIIYSLAAAQVQPLGFQFVTYKP